MPPLLDPAASGRERRIHAVIDFAKDLLEKLSMYIDSSSDEAILADVNHHIHSLNALRQNSTNLTAQSSKELKECGRKLWNQCIKEQRKSDDISTSGERSMLFVRTRCFAFQITAIAREGQKHKRGDNHEEDTIIYLFSLALKVGKHCIEEGDLDGARLGLHRVADYLEKLKATDRGSQGGQNIKHTLEVEYLTMRTALAWKEDRLDVAEHMFVKAEAIEHHLDPSSAEHMADTLWHIGSDLFSKKDYSMAIKWLQRAYKLINGQDLERLSAQGSQLRLDICHYLVQTLLATDIPNNIQKADDMVAYVESEIGDKPVVLHWKLEILDKSPQEGFDTDAYASVLRRMVRSFDFNDNFLEFFHCRIKKLRERSFRLSIALLDELLFTRLLPLKKPDWIGKSVICRVWISTMETESVDAANELSDTFDNVLSKTGTLLGPPAVVAAQSLIWKKLEANYAEEKYDATISWCQVALHGLLANCGNANKGKFGRKLILCAIHRNDMETALSTFQIMPQLVQDDPLTRYLMFKVSLQIWDLDLGCESIAHLSKSADHEKCQDILYACIKEAQQAGDRLCTLAALKAIVEKSDAGVTIRAHLPSVLRCIIRLIHLVESEDPESQNNETGMATDTCDIFEKAAAHAKSDPRDADGNKVFTIPELDWFRKNAYNVGVSKCHVWELCHLIRIFGSCLGFIQCFPIEVPSCDVRDMQIMAMRCHFIISAALISQARTEDMIEEQLQLYVEMRQHIASFDMKSEVIFCREPNPADEQLRSDMLAKASTLFVFDFEGAVCLRSWEELGQIVRKAKVCKDELMYKAMGDCLLRSHAPGKVLYATMRLIINEIFELDNFDNQRLAKYIRCMFQVILPLEDGLALQVVDQALQIAREGSQMGNPFPADELDWVVATTFNHAMDILARGDAALCQQWALKALAVAEHMDDGGGLRKELRERIVKLGFDKEQR